MNFKFNHRVQLSETPEILDNILSQAIPRMREDGRSEEEIAQQSYDFAAQQLRLAESRQVIYLNNLIAKAIEEMAFLGQWTNLAQIAKHALREAFDTCKRLQKAEVDRGRSGSLHGEMAEYYSLQSDFLRTGHGGFEEFIQRLQKLIDIDKRINPLKTMVTGSVKVTDLSIYRLIYQKDGRGARVIIQKTPPSETQSGRDIGEVYADLETEEPSYGYLLYESDAGGDCIDSPEDAMQLLISDYEERQATQAKA